MRTAELFVETKGESWKSSRQNEKTKLGNRSIRHAPGGPAPSSQFGTGAGNADRKESAESRRNGNTTKQYYSQHP